LINEAADEAKDQSAVADINSVMNKAESEERKLDPVEKVLKEEESKALVKIMQDQLMTASKLWVAKS
jgi:hypothetical protein